MAKIFDFSGLACLDFYKVRERLAVGQVSNMFTILETQMQAHCIIQP
jgi:hypothetical protein